MSKHESKPENPAAALARMRSESLSPERRSEIARKAGKASGESRMKNLSPEQRREIAQKAGRASAKARRKKARAAK